MRGTTNSYLVTLRRDVAPVALAAGGSAMRVVFVFDGRAAAGALAVGIVVSIIATDGDDDDDDDDIV